jgi:hypothetical protein
MTSKNSSSAWSGFVAAVAAARNAIGGVVGGMTMRQTIIAAVSRWIATHMGTRHTRFAVIVIMIVL